MKKTHFYMIGAISISMLAACNGNTGTGAATSDSTMNNGGTTTTTTTTVTHHKYVGKFMPQPDMKYLDLQTNKQIPVRIDTNMGQIVNAETNDPVGLLVDPIQHDTIYGQTGTVVNNYIIKDESGYRVDTVRINTVEVQTVAATPEASPEPTGKYKEKDKYNKTKIKTDNEKIKEKNGVIKEKDR